MLILAISNLIKYHTIMNDFLKNGLFQKALSTGIEFALTAGEKLQTIVAEAIEKAKNYQETRKEKAEKAEESEQEPETQAAEAATDNESTDKDSENTSETKSTRWEDYEQRLRRLADAAISKFNFIRNDDHEKLEARIVALEEKMAKIAQQLATQGEDSHKQ